MGNLVHMVKRTIISTVLFLMIVIAFPMNVSAASVIYPVNTNCSFIIYATKDANIRRGPSTEYEIMGHAEFAEALIAVDVTENNWYKIIIDGKEGYISGTLVIFNKPEHKFESQPSIITEPEPPATTEPVPSVEIQQIEPEPVFNPYEDMGSHLWDFAEDEIITYVIALVTTPEMNSYDKAVALNNYLCNTIVYDKTHSHRSTFDALAYGTGVCQGYANAYMKLMNAAGIPTDYVRGYAGGGHHAWNRSFIDGNYYYTDVTWNDCLGYNQYLLISNEQMSTDHSEICINPENRIK